MLIETDLEKIKLIGEKKDEENWKFRSYLKGLDIDSKDLDKIVHELNEKISSQIDCTKCANCCKHRNPIMDKEDIKQFITGLEIAEEEFLEKYCEADTEEPDKYYFNQFPCSFLENDKCVNYNYRPEDCRSFPHLHKKDFVHRLYGVLENYSVCPIVFNVYEQLKKVLWHRHWRASIRQSRF